MLAGLQFPSQVKVNRRYKVSGTECLMILLRRLAYPSRHCDLGHLFGRSETAISTIFNHALNHVYEKCKHLLAFDWERLNAEYLEEMYNVNRRAGSLLEDCVGYIDGTIRPMCKPGRNQKLFYNGHKRVHCLKFQNIVFPDGIIVFMDGPYSGTRHDSGMLHVSEVEATLRGNLKGRDGRQLYIYGDLGYPDRSCIVRPYGGSQLSEEQQHCNVKSKDFCGGQFWQNCYSIPFC